MRPLISNPPARPSAIEKSLFALVRAESHPVRSERHDLARMIYADDKVVSAIVERGAAPLGTTTGSGWASQLTQNLVADFVGTLTPMSAAAQLVAIGLQVNMAGAVGMKVPAREGQPSTTVAWVGEGGAIPVRAFSVNDNCELVPRKHGFIIGLSRELAKRANGEAVIRQLIREDAAATLDGAYFSTAAGDAIIHPGMLAGVTAGSGYAGGDRTAIAEDLGALSDIVSAAGSGQVVFIVSPKRAAKFKIIAPEINREITMLPSLAVADTRVIAVDPLSWAHGFGDDFDLDASEAATLHMSDTPLEIVSDVPVVADPVRSYFQTNSLALRMLADVAFAARRPNAVAYLDGVTW